MRGTRSILRSTGMRNGMQKGRMAGRSMTAVKDAMYRIQATANDADGDIPAGAASNMTINRRDAAPSESGAAAPDIMNAV